MLQFDRWQIGTIIGVLLLGLYFTVPNFFPKGQAPWGFANTGVTLGLDLQGGSHLLLEVDTDKVLDDRVSSLQSDIRRELRRGDGGRIGFGQLDIQDRSITVPIADPANMDEAFKRLRTLARPVGGLVGGGGRDYRPSRDDSANTITPDHD